MVGGTAVALHLGHRKSIDFDLFLSKSFSHESIRGILERSKQKWDALHVSNEYNMTGVIWGVKCTFFSFPFDIMAEMDFEWVIKIPNLLTLGAMKAYALGRRAKWKDYVDLYFILRKHHGVHEISMKAREIFGWNFNTKLFREQLCYFDTIDYSEEVEYLIPNPPTDEEIKKFLIEKAIED